MAVQRRRRVRNKLASLVITAGVLLIVASIVTVLQLSNIRTNRTAGSIASKETTAAIIKSPATRFGESTNVSLVERPWKETVSNTGHALLAVDDEPPAPLPPAAWLQDYIELNKNHSIPYIRYVCPRAGVCGGTGDRISGILQAFYMALCTNRRILIDWKTPAPLQDYLQPNHHQYIDWTWQPSERDMINAIHIESKDDPTNVYLNRPEETLPPEGNIDLEINTWLGDDVLFEQYTCLQNVTIDSSTTSLYRIAFWTLFQWSPAVNKATLAFRQSTTPSLEQPYLAIHVRTGQGASFEDPLTESSSRDAWTQYLTCAQRMRQLLIQQQQQQQHESGTLTGTTLPIFVAADTTDVASTLQKLDSAIVTSPVAKEIYHMDRTVADRLHDPASALLQVWVDLKLLVESQCIVMSTGMKHGKPSKFSRMAMWLSHQQPRCAVLWHDCNDEGAVEEAVANVK